MANHVIPQILDAHRRQPNEKSKIVWFAHSMGSWVLYECLNRLKSDQEVRLPGQIGISCFPAPFATPEQRPWNPINPSTPDVTIQKELQAWDPNIINPKLFLPSIWPMFQGIMKADMLAYSNYWRKQDPLQCFEHPCSSAS